MHKTIPLFNGTGYTDYFMIGSFHRHINGTRFQFVITSLDGSSWQCTERVTTMKLFDIDKVGPCLDKKELFQRLKQRAKAQLAEVMLRVGEARMAERLTQAQTQFKIEERVRNGNSKTI